MRATWQKGTAGRGARPRGGRKIRLVLLALLFAALTACTNTPARQRAVADLPPLQLETGTVSVAEVETLAPTPDLLATDQAMRDFVERYTGGVVSSRQRLMNLHRAVRGHASLGIEYDPVAGGTAQEVFHRGTANCLSYATLFVALAREAGLRAEYQWLHVRPEWTLRGERVQVRLHVNVLVKATHQDRFMIDIDPVPTREIAGSRRIQDTDAVALHHANAAMDALAAGAVEQAWLQSVRALQLSPDMPHLWVNLGAIYRHAGQNREAEENYLYALELDPWNDSAMNNLVVLYAMEGRDEERAHWEARVASYRDGNPYYHAWLGDQAADEQDWRQARDYYEKALELLPEDSRLLYALGLAHYQLDEPAAATDYIERAIERATLRSDIDTYQLQLRSLRGELDSSGVEG